MADGITMAGVTSEPVLTDEQRARGQALIIARDILAQRGGGPFASVSLNGASVWDLISMSEYVLNGRTVDDVDDPEPGSAVIVAVPDEALAESRILQNAGHGVMLVPLSARLVSFDEPDETEEGDVPEPSTEPEVRDGADEEDGS